MSMFFSFLYLKDYEEDYTGQCCHAENNIQSFHIYSSMSSFGVIKYASSVKAVKDILTTILKKRDISPVIKLPIAPAVSVYLAASANITPIILRRPLFTFNRLYHKIFQKLFWNYASTVSMKTLALKQCICQIARAGRNVTL